MNKKILIIFGTRPEAIKMCPLLIELKQNSMFDVKCAITGQHREMLDSVLSHFEIIPDYDLNIMHHGQTLTSITDAVLNGMERIFSSFRPDIALVHGDTSTAFAAALAAFYHQIAVGHVEAGMRSFDMYSPYPEEMNRKLIGSLASVHFAATESAAKNLLAEGIQSNKVFITGNTVVDALRLSHKENYEFTESPLSEIDFAGRRVILLTCHRRENIGDSMFNIFSAVKDVLEKYPDVEFVYPIHKNQMVRDIFKEVGICSSRMHLIEPLNYDVFINLMEKSYIILTDSGGIQEEAPYFGRPVIVVRDVTERMEAVHAGTVVMAGTKKTDVYRHICRLLDDNDAYSSMSKAINPYGDGYACRRICEDLSYYFGLSQDFAPHYNTSEEKVFLGGNDNE